MAVGLKQLSNLHPVPGVRLGTVSAGICEHGRRDLVVIECAAGTQAAAVFTRNCFRAAPVRVAQDHLAKSVPRALVINTGFANAGTGKDGMQDALSCCRALASELNCTVGEILPFSTGIIGERLPAQKVISALPACVADINETGWIDAAHGIMTTDTIAKGCSRKLTIGETSVTITGIVKGAGMIRPDMATMLAFIATDASISKEILDACLQNAVNSSFNRITVDGDTSTNDACVLLATGRAQHTPITAPTGGDYELFLSEITAVCVELAQAIVRDAEGTTKFVTVVIEQGRSESECLQVAYTIAHSPLVKTAFFASDPNWGRILAAVGRAGVRDLDINSVHIYLNDLCIVKNGSVAEGYTKAKGARVMAETEIRIRVLLGTGRHSACIWTSDLSYDYVKINAEYRS